MHGDLIWRHKCIETLKHFTPVSHGYGHGCQLALRKIILHLYHPLSSQIYKLKFDFHMFL